MANHILIVGGSDAGISAGLRIKELTPNTDVTLLTADRYPNFSICGLPFYLSGEVADWRSLAHRTQDEILSQGIHVLTGHRAVGIRPAQKEVAATDSEGRMVTFYYDKLMLCTGGVSQVPAWPGIDSKGVFFLRWMTDAFALHEDLLTGRPQSLLIIGGGYIGLEMAEAMSRRGLEVTLAEYAPNVLTTFDSVFGSWVQGDLEGRGISVHTHFNVQRIESVAGKLRAVSVDDRCLTADRILVAAGSAPDVSLAESAGLAIGVRGAICVNRNMETGVANIYAAGDCVETYHRLIGKNTYIPLGSTAHRQGRVAGEYPVGKACDYEGTLGTQSLKVFDWVAARTGLKDDEAAKAGFDPLSVDVETWDHKRYYPGATPLRIRLSGDRQSGRLLGCQMIGARTAEVSKRIDIVSTAIYSGLCVRELNHLDLSYTPPLSTPWDPVQLAAQAWERSWVASGHMTGLMTIT